MVLGNHGDTHDNYDKGYLASDMLSPFGSELMIHSEEVKSRGVDIVHLSPLPCGCFAPGNLLIVNSDLTHRGSRVCKA